MTYDPPRDRLILSLKYYPTWVGVSPGGVALGGRGYPSGVYEPDQDLMIVFGGAYGTTRLNDTKRLDCAGGWWLDTGGANGTVTQSPTKPCYGTGEVVALQAMGQPSYGFQQWLGDASGTIALIDMAMDNNKVVIAQFHTGSVGVEEKPPLAFALGRIHPNPSAGPAEIEYSIPYAARVKLRVFDVTGREVARLVDGPQPAGRHVASWSGTAATARARSGIYRVRFETPDGTWVRRLALVR